MMLGRAASVIDVKSLAAASSTVVETSCDDTVRIDDFAIEIRRGIQEYLEGGGYEFFFVPGFGALSIDMRCSVWLFAHRRRPLTRVLMQILERADVGAFRLVTEGDMMLIWNLPSESCQSMLCIVCDLFISPASIPTARPGNC